MENPHLTHKIPFGALLLFLTALLFHSHANADVIKLQSGGRIEGIIERETADNVFVEIKFGRMTLKRSDIASIEKASNAYNKSLKERWNKEKSSAKTEITPVKIETKPQPVKTEVKKTQPAAQPAKKTPQRKPGAIAIIKCNDGVHSYAVCLPSDYEKRGECPVLFCFDPGGDGTQAVRRFLFAAEKYGWIVVGSLNARNGPWEPILKAQSAMLQDIPKRYKTNDRKYYAAGFSGGARMSYTIAYNNPSKFRGIIACGAGFGQGSTSKKVAVYNCVGGTDSNLKEVKNAYAELDKKGVKTELKIFPGGHDWPSDIVLKQAVDWIAKN